MTCQIVRRPPAEAVAPLKTTVRQSDNASFIELTLELRPESNALWSNDASFVFGDHGVVATEMCGQVYAAGTTFQTSCFKQDEHAAYELKTRLLVCYFANECDPDAAWVQDAFANSSQWINAYSYGDKGQCRSVVQHTHIDVENGVFVGPETTVSTNYTVPTGEEVSLVTEAFKFWLPLFIIGVIAILVVVGPCSISFRRKRYSAVVEELNEFNDEEESQ